MAKEIKRIVFELISEISYFLRDKFTRLIKVNKFLSHSSINLNLGCGNNIKKGFINIDLNKTADLQMDLRKTLPFKDNSVDYIYSEHFLEHIDYYDGTVMKCLKDYHRILKSNGKIRLIVPVIKAAIIAYYNKQNEQYELFDKKFNLRIPKSLFSPIDYVNRFSYALGVHKYSYDYEKLKKILKAVGFKNIIKDKYNPTEDSESRKDFSLYVQAEKI